MCGKKELGMKYFGVHKSVYVDIYTATKCEVLFKLKKNFLKSLIWACDVLQNMR